MLDSYTVQSESTGMQVVRNAASCAPMTVKTYEALVQKCRGRAASSAI